MASAAVSALLGGGLSAIAPIINSIRGRNPEDAAKLQELLTRHQDLIVQTQADLTKADIQSNVDLNSVAGQNIRAEQTSRYTAWARPSIVYAWIAVIIYNYVVCGFINRAPLTMPADFWTYSGLVIGGYVCVRTGQEVATKVLGGAGGSIKLPFGINAESKGD